MNCRMLSVRTGVFRGDSFALHLSEVASVMDKIESDGAKGMVIVSYGPGSELDRDRDLGKKENEYF